MCIPTGVFPPACLHVSACVGKCQNLTLCFFFFCCVADLEEDFEVVNDGNAKRNYLKMPGPSDPAFIHECGQKFKVVAIFCNPCLFTRSQGH